MHVQSTMGTDLPRRSALILNRLKSSVAPLISERERVANSTHNSSSNELVIDDAVSNRLFEHAERLKRMSTLHQAVLSAVPNRISLLHKRRTIVRPRLRASVARLSGLTLGSADMDSSAVAAALAKPMPREDRGSAIASVFGQMMFTRHALERRITHLNLILFSFGILTLIASIAADQICFDYSLIAYAPLGSCTTGTALHCVSLALLIASQVCK